MIEVEDFYAVFGEAGYTSGLVDTIDQNRRILGGKTFFERLLELLQIKWRKMYPPKSKDQLHELHSRIANAPISLHYKHCLIFYLLKDLSPSNHDLPELADAFARDVHLEKRFWTFVEGLWALDHLQFETAVGNLTHPSIIPTFPDEIMSALLQRKDYSDLADNDILPLAYYNCAKPPLANKEVKTEFVKYMADRNVTETFYWIRARPEYEHKQLLEILIEQTLDRTTFPRTGKDTDYSREDKTMELVDLPFDEEEEKWVEKFLTEGRGRSLVGAGDTVLMRRIATGRMQEAANDAGIKGRRHDHINWEVLKDGISRGLGPRADEESHFVV